MLYERIGSFLACHTNRIFHLQGQRNLPKPVKIAAAKRIATPMSTTVPEKEVLSERKTASAVKAASPASVHLDAIRGIAALVVFLNHWRALFFADYPQLQHPGISAKVFYALTGLGHSAVMVFFVLSGFFISSSIFRAQQNGRWSWAWYAEQRLTRLYVVLIPALVLGAGWDLLGTHLFRQTPIYLDTADYRLMLNHSVAQMDTVQAWFGCLFFLQGIRTAVFGSNGPLWSLSYEFWYYLLFPLGLFAVSRKSKATAKAAYLAAGLLVFVFIGKGIALYFVIWLLGTFVYLCRPPRVMASKAAGCLFAFLFVVSLLAPRFKLVPNGQLSDFFVAVTFSAFLLFLLNSERSTPSILYTKAARSLSNISYSLYLLHVPVLVFLNAVIIRQGSRWQPTATHLGVGVLVGGVVFLYTYGIWYFTEARTGQVREKITFLLSSTRSAA
jgi:peptidoglycan/LPS O-acetylase OafA/YrhL